MITDKSLAYYIFIISTCPQPVFPSGVNLFLDGVMLIKLMECWGKVLFL